MCYRQFFQTHVTLYYCRQVQPQYMRAFVRACADDDDEIILGIIALVVVKAE